MTDIFAMQRGMWLFFVFCFVLKHALFKHGLMTHLKGNQTEGANGPENIQNGQIVSSAGLIRSLYQYLYLFIFKLKVFFCLKL